MNSQGRPAITPWAGATSTSKSWDVFLFSALSQTPVYTVGWPQTQG